VGLSFDPVGGGQFKAAIKQIMEAERQPLRQLEAKKATEESKLKVFQEFKNKFTGLDKAIDEISGFRKMREFKVDLGDGANIATVTIDKDKVQPGSYQLQVDELAARTSVISSGFENPDETIFGLGFIVMKLENGETSEVFVDESNSSLRGIASLINSTPSSPIRAAVIQDAGNSAQPWKLILTGKKDGAENRIDFPEFYFMDGSRDFYIKDQRDARNSVIRLNGFEFEQTSNDINEFLPGVNLHLKQAKPDQPFTLTISEDIQKVGGKVKAMVDQLNGILGFINKQNAIDASTDTRNTLAGDTGLQSIEFRIRNLLHEGFPMGDPEENEDVPLLFLGQIGIEFDKAGTISFKEDRFNKMLEKNFEGMAEAISGKYGFAYQLKELMAGYTRAGSGTLAIREQGFRNRMKDIDRQIDDRARRLEKREQTLTDQFARLESSMANMQKQQQYLSATLPGAGGGGLIGQLLG
jgi:flagellar hook-associated protein 2